MDICRGYRLEMDSREKNKELKAKSKIPRSLKVKISRNERNKINKDQEKFGYKIPNNSREAILLDKKNGNTLWDDEISKEITSLERLVVLQFYLLKIKFGKKYGWRYAPMHMVFYVKHQDFQHKSSLVVVGHVVYSMENTIYSYTIKDVSVIIMILIAVNNGLVLVAEDIGN